MHRQRVRVHGRDALPTMNERFDAKWQLDPATGCHVWTAGFREGGYGWFRDDRKSVAAHIFAWERKNGPTPSGLVLDHFACDNPPCCNPDHVRPETRGGNVLRGTAPSAVNARKQRCIRGHDLMDEANLYRPPKKPHFRQCRQCIQLRSRARAH